MLFPFMCPLRSLHTTLDNNPVRLKTLADDIYSRKRKRKRINIKVYTVKFYFKNQRPKSIKIQ